MVYKWNSYNYSVSAQVVGEEIEKIKKKKNEFTTKDFVNAARSEKSVLHPLLEWNDKEGAEKYREYQARLIIARLMVVPEKTEEPETRAFVCVSPLHTHEKGRFTTIKEALENTQTKEVVLKNALAELSAFKRKYQTLTELSKVIKAIDELEIETE